MDMNYTRDYDLYVIVFSEIAKLHDDVAYRKRSNEYRASSGAKAKQYPAATVGALYSEFKEFGNHHSPAAKNLLHKSIIDGFRKRLNTRINEVSPFCNNAVGHCAENYAASKVLKKIDAANSPLPNIEELSFTYAFQPRTWKKIEWCSNCHRMFDGNDE